MTGKTLAKPGPSQGQARAKQIGGSNDAESRSTGINRWKHIGCTLDNPIARNITNYQLPNTNYHITGVVSGISLLHLLHGAKNQYMLITEPYPDPSTLALRLFSTVQSPDRTSAIRSRSPPNPPIYFITSRLIADRLSNWYMVYSHGILSPSEAQRERGYSTPVLASSAT